MKGNKKRVSALFAAAFMSVSMAAATQAPGIVLADSGDPGMTFGASALAKNAGQENMQKLWYGRWNNPALKRDWFVIGYDGAGNSVAARKGAATLLSVGYSGELHYFRVNSLDNYVSNYYNDSDVATILEHNYYQGAGVYSWNDAKEKEAVLGRRLEGWSENYDTPGYDSNKIKGNTVENAHFWLLSSAEAKELPESILRVGSYDSKWWLRSPGRQSNFVATVQAYDSLTSDPQVVVDFHGSDVDVRREVRPAFDLNLNAVSLTSSAHGGKQSGEGADALAEVAPNTNNEWKLTLKDSARSAFKAELVSYDNETKTMTVKYSGAAVGANEYVSAIIKDSSDNIKYYGRFANVTSQEASSGTISMNLAGKYGEGDTIYVFSEQMNGDQTTDYASELIEIKGYRVKSVNYDNRYHCTVKLPTEYCLPGEIYTFETVPDKGYKADLIRISTDIDNTIEYTRDEYNHNKFSFVMPPHDVNIYALASEAHTVERGLTYNCTINLPSEYGLKGETYSFEVMPDEGYMVKEIRVLDRATYEPADLGDTLKRDENNGYRFSFTMPDKDLIILAGVEKAHASGGDEDPTDPTTTAPEESIRSGETDPTTPPAQTLASPTKAAASAAKSYAVASGSSAVKTQSVSTGDKNESIIWIPICAAAAAGIVLTAVIRRKRS